MQVSQFTMIQKFTVIAHRIAARPKLLLNVCVTQTLAYSLTSVAALDPSAAKSMYASSTITKPLKFLFSSTLLMTSMGIRVPVGLPGEQMNSIFRSGWEMNCSFI